VATSFQIEVKTSKKIVDFIVQTDDGYSTSYGQSNTGNLKISSGFFGGQTLSARMRDGVSSCRFIAVTSAGERFDLGTAAPFSPRKVSM